MTTSFGGKTCYDPGPLKEYCDGRGLPTEFWGRANSYSNPLGPQCGRGWCLLLKKDVDDLNFSTWSKGSCEFYIGDKLVAKQVWPIRTICVDGSLPNADSLYLVEFVDWRYFALKFSFCPGASFNVLTKSPLAGSGSTPDPTWFVRGSLRHTTMYGGSEGFGLRIKPPTVWTWDQMLDEISFFFRMMRSATDNDYTFPRVGSSDFTPTNIILGIGNAWIQYNDILLNQLRYAYSYDAASDLDSFIDLTIRDNDFTKSISGLDDKILLDYDCKEPPYALYSEFSSNDEGFGTLTNGFSRQIMFSSPNSQDIDGPVSMASSGGLYSAGYITNGTIDEEKLIDGCKPGDFGTIFHGSEDYFLQSFNFYSDAITTENLEEDNVVYDYSDTYLRALPLPRYYITQSSDSGPKNLSTSHSSRSSLEIAKTIHYRMSNGKTFRRSYSGILSNDDYSQIDFSSLIKIITWREYQGSDCITDIFGIPGLLQKELTRPVSCLYPDSYTGLVSSDPASIEPDRNAYSHLRSTRPNRYGSVIVVAPSELSLTAYTPSGSNDSGLSWGYVRPVDGLPGLEDGFGYGSFTLGGGPSYSDSTIWYAAFEVPMNGFSRHYTNTATRPCLVCIRSGTDQKGKAVDGFEDSSPVTPCARSGSYIAQYLGIGYLQGKYFPIYAAPIDQVTPDYFRTYRGTESGMVLTMPST